MRTRGAIVRQSRGGVAALGWSLGVCRFPTALRPMAQIYVADVSRSFASLPNDTRAAIA